MHTDKATLTGWKLFLALALLFSSLTSACSGGSDGAQDACAGVTCERGVCDAQTGQCISAPSCNADDGHDACIEGEKCLQGQCRDRQDYCEALDCTRGVCSFDQESCVNDSSCSDDTACLSGYYCGDDGTCLENTCDAQGVDCPRGVCDPASGECVDPASCQQATDCLDGHVCLSQSSASTCVARADACGQPGCSGNQVCEYDAGALEATCAENPDEPCRDARDCVDGRVCNGRTCQDSPACSPDAFEPNDDAQQASPLVGSPRVPRGGLDASLCSGDTDLYVFDSREAEQSQGTLYLALDIAQRDRGLGDLRMVVRAPDGSVAADQTSDAAGQVRAQVSVGGLRQGEFTIEVSAAGSVADAGVDYHLYAKTLPQTVFSACDDATVLELDTPVTGDVADGTSAALNSACAAPDFAASERIYRFEITEPSQVTVTLTPQVGADLSVELRDSCLRDDLELTCADGAGPGETEAVKHLLDPGTYFVVVQATPQTSATGFELEVSAVTANCGPSDSYCSGEQTAQVCVAGSALRERSCRTSCEPDTGHCTLPQAESCATAPAIGAGFETTISWRAQTNDVQIAPDTCLTDRHGATATEGADAVYAVSVGPDQGVTASLTPQVGADAAVYLVRSCQAATSSCVDGANYDEADALEAYYFNDTGTRQTLYVVADAASSVDSGQADLSVQIDGVVCQASSLRCDGDELQTCNIIGTGWHKKYHCNFGCSGGVCNPPTNETCDTAIDLVPGQTVTQRIDAYIGDYSPGYTTCAETNSFGPDAVYRVETTQPDQIVSVDVDAPFDAVVYMLRSCQALTANCVAGADEDGAGGHESTTFLAEEPGEWFVVVDAHNASAVGAFEVTATVTPASCSPGEVVGCSTSQTGVLEYCDATGQIMRHSCDSGSCSNGRCDNPTGEICIEAVPVSDGQSVTGDFQGPDDIHYDRGQTGQCFFGSGLGTEGADKTYVIDLQPGELLEADLATDDPYARLYFMTDCASQESCVGGVGQSGDQAKYFYSEDGGPVTAVVDRTQDTPTQETYTLTFDVLQNRQCRPGQPTCTSPTTVGVCNLSGTAYRRSYDCPSGCSNGACRQAPNVVSCMQAPDVGDGVFVYGNYDEYTDDIALGQASCLSGATENGPDAAYKVSMNAGDVLSARVRAVGDERPLLYVVSDCSDAANTCLAGDAEEQGNRRASVAYTASSAEDVYVVVDSEIGSPDEPYLLEIDKRTPQCTPGAQTCDADGQTLLECDARGLWEPHLCSSGTCSADSCQSPSGQSCSEPVILQDGATVTGDWSGTDEVYVPAGHHGQCIFASNAPPQGPETVYQIDLQAGDLLEADLSSTDPDALLYFMGDCTQPSSCVGGGPSAANQTQYYFAETAGPVRIVVDRGVASTSTQTYSLSVSVSPAMSCRPDEPSCLDATTVQICGDMGLNQGQTFSCPGGCVDGACAPSLPDAEVCASAPNVGGGLMLYGSFADATDDVTIPAASCTHTEGLGPDIVHKAVLSPGEVLRARVESFDDEQPMVYFVRGCPDAADSCVAAGHTEPGQTEAKKRVATAAYAAQANETIYVVTDSALAGAQGLFSLSIDKTSSQCTPGQRRCDPNDATKLQVCQDSHLYASYACNGPCSSAACDNPTGEACPDAVPLAKDASFVGSFADYGADVDPGVGTCVRSFDFDPVGPDAVFAVDLNAGDILEASLDTTADHPTMYVLDSCAGSVRDDCRWADTGDELAFWAPNDATYYLVVDSTDATESAPFALDLSTRTGGACQPDGTTCDDASGQITGCGELGDAVEYTGQCANGCDGRLCAPVAAANDTCSGAQLISSSTRIVDSFSRFSDTLHPSACGVSGSGGPEAIYEVQLAAGKSLKATVRALNYYLQPYVYITTSCTSPGPSCVDGARATGGVAQAGYHATTTQTVFVVVDSPYSPLDADFELDLSITDAECSAGQSRCATSDVMETCSSYGVYQQRDCSFGCNGGSCNAPPNDECVQATTVPRDGATHTYQARIDAYSNDYDAANATGQSCTWDGWGGDTAGPDAVYQVDLQPGDILTVDYQGVDDEAIWVSDSCPGSGAAMADHCVAGVDDNAATQGESLVFVSPNAATYYVVADLDTTQSVSGSFEVDITIEAQSCTPGEATCTASDTLQYCNDLGTGLANFTCQGQCSGAAGAAACTQPTGDICVDAIAAPNGGSFTVDPTAHTNAIDLPISACVGSPTGGQDVIFAVDVVQGETLQVSATPASGSWDDPLVYVLADCHRGAATNTSCVAGSDAQGPNAAETLSYSVQTTGTVYVVVDAASASSSSWTIDITRN